MDKPFTPIVLSSIIGILIAYYFNVSMAMIIFLLVLFVFVFIYNILYDKTNNHVSILLVFLLLNILNTNINKSSSLILNIDKRYDYIGIVDEIVAVNDIEGKYIVIINKILGNESLINEKIVLKVIGDKVMSLGDTISINGVLRLPMENTNPMLYNSKLNLLSDKIHTSMTIKDFSVDIIETNTKLKYRLKDKFIKDTTNLFDSYLNEENSALISSIILGKSSYLDETELLKYRELGLAHILAVSGLHIGIISSFIIFILSRIGIKRKINIILSLTIIWAYVYIIGFPPSTVRASLMFSILFYSQLIHEPYDSINTIMVSILISLFINPYWLFSIGFQLSYIATFSILIFTPRIIKLFYPYKNNTILALSSILAVNIGLLPLQAYYFNRVSLLGIISNIIAVPLLSFALIIGISMIILNYTISFLNLGLGFILNILLSVESKVVDFLYEIPFNFIKLYSPNMLVILLYFFALGIIFDIIKINQLKIGVKKAIIYFLLIVVLINSLYALFDQSINIDFIDVGQGDAILIKAQGSNYLMDTGGSLLGGFDIGKYITVPYLEKLGINKLDGVIITHFDADHSQGLDALIDNIKISNIFSSYIPEDQHLIEKIKENEIPLTIINENDVIKFDKNTYLKIIYPGYKADLSSLSNNNKSIVSLLSYKDTNILFTGDIEKEVEVQLIRKKIENINLLKIPHHGSDTSTTMDFLNELLPRYSIISVGRNNSYSHPHNDVLERLKKTDSLIYRTDEMGLIRVYMNNKDISINYFLDASNKQVNIMDFILKNIIIISFYFVYYLLAYILIKKYIDMDKEGVVIELQ